MGATGNGPIYAAIVTGTAALLGVLIGGLLQYFFSERELERKKAQALNVVTFFIAEILAVLNEFNSEQGLEGVLALSLRMPKFLQEQLGILNTAISEFDPEMAIDLLWVKQACTNVDAYLAEARKLGKTNQLHKNIGPILGMALVDVKAAIKYSKRILIRGYNAADRKTRAELFKKESLQEFFGEKCAERNRFIKGLIKHGLKKI